jgi:copper chaperone CopZ
MTISWNVPKITCDGCVQSIVEALLILDGLYNVTVDLATKTVSFEAKSQSDIDNARRALVKAGYPVVD